MISSPSLTAPLTDPEHRAIRYLRLSITDRCNLRCLYCAPDGRVPRLAHDQILSYEEILRVVQVGVGLGIRKVRVTGGEPLVRKGVVDLLRRLVAIPEIEDVSLTTNGVLLESCAKAIFDAGVRRINVSLDSLNRQRYAHITGYDRFDRVWAGILRAHAMGFSPIKINVVAMRRINDDEIADFARLSMAYPFHIRFIEYMPIGNSRTTVQDQILTPEIQDRIRVLGELVPVEGQKNDGPARRFRISGAKGEVGFISALSQHFCDQCNRLRLTADGKLRACLLSDRYESLKEALRSGKGDAAVADVFRTAVQKKWAGHRLGADDTVPVTEFMQKIGG
ncbi:GTP 3',8-cyclase MoaA [Desulfosarcina sp. OttesenSCG-928-A07]|nr:GTP 3',8-cyclase MoaA [Desulfosarcina sp. OttesenSCG-928-G17]MDL2330154.1 GTP 3',8-cyclase MoaA [Desulfosarcina sp. OttesenSCG-928-A07]